MKTKTLLLAAILSYAAGPAVAAKNPMPEVEDRGKDGDLRYYRVRCTDKTTIHILAANKDEGTICYRVDREKICLKTLDTDAAALRACATTQ